MNTLLPPLEQPDEIFRSWITESTKLKVIFASPNSSVHLFAGGTFKQLPGGFAVSEQASGEKERLAFSAKQFISCTLLDGATACVHPLAQRFFSGMVFVRGVFFLFKSTETLVLLEVAHNRAN